MCMGVIPVTTQRALLDTVRYAFACLVPVNYMRTVTAKRAKQVFKWGSMKFAIRSVKQLINLLHKHQLQYNQHQRSLKQTKENCM